MRSWCDMKKFIYILMLLMVPLLTITYGCGSEEKKGTPDSVFSISYIANIGITEPERALALIDTAEQRGLMNDFDLNRLRAVVYHNGLSDNIKSLEYALKAYDSPEARVNGQKYLRLMQMIADQYYLNGDYPQSVKFCTEGIKIAQDSSVRSAEANLDFKLGRNLLVLNREDEGFGYYYKAVDILDEESKKDRTWETSDDYIYTLAILIGTLRNEGYYDKATELLPRYDEAVNHLKTKEGIPEGLVDMRQASGYGMAAHLYAINGEKDKAHEQYLKLCSTDYAKTPDAGQLIIPYLYEIGDYRGALLHLQAEKEYWQANTDTVSYSYIENHLESELGIYEQLGDIGSANRVLHTIQSLNDTLRERDRNEKALELAEIYKTNEQALQIERQSASILLRNVIIVAGLVLLVIGVIFILRILRLNRTISTKNRAMVQTIDDLIGYKDRVLELQEVILQSKGIVRSELEQTTLNSEQLQPEVIPETSAETSDFEFKNDADSNETIELTDKDRASFERMNFEILSRHLYLNPKFSRATVLDQFKVPAYKFSAVFKEYAGCSFSQYIHNCRLDYAVKLMRENPSWSLEAIAKAAQMSNSSFYSQFKKKYGMSPSVFKNCDESVSSGIE